MPTVTAIIKKLSEFVFPMEFGRCPLKFSLQNYIKLPDQPTPKGICLALLFDPDLSLIDRWIESLIKIMIYFCSVSVRMPRVV